MVNARWKRMARSNDPISTRVDKDITLNDNIRIGVDASIRALHKCRHRLICAFLRDVLM